MSRNLCNNDNSSLSYPRNRNINCDNCEETPIDPCVYTRDICLRTENSCGETEIDTCCPAPPARARFILEFDENNFSIPNDADYISFQNWRFETVGGCMYEFVDDVFPVVPTWTFDEFMNALLLFLQGMSQFPEILTTDWITRNGNEIWFEFGIGYYSNGIDLISAACSCNIENYVLNDLEFLDGSFQTLAEVNYTTSVICCEDCLSAQNDDYIRADFVFTYSNTNRTGFDLKLNFECIPDQFVELFHYEYVGGILTLQQFVYNVSQSATGLLPSTAYVIFNGIDRISVYIRKDDLPTNGNAECLCDLENWNQSPDTLSWGVGTPGVINITTTTECCACEPEIITVFNDVDIRKFPCVTNHVYSNLTQTLGPETGTLTNVSLCLDTFAPVEPGYYEFEMEYNHEDCDTITRTITARFFVFPTCENCWVAINLHFNTEIENVVGDLTFEFSNIGVGFSDLTITLNNDSITDIVNMLTTAAGGFFSVVEESGVSVTFFGQFPCEFCVNNQGLIGQFYINEFTNSNVSSRCADPNSPSPFVLFIDNDIVAVPFTINY